MHSIFVIPVNGSGGEKAHILATEIESGATARKIARNLAFSYSEHGTDRSEMVYWFKDSAGLHYIWAGQETIRESGGKNASFPLSQLLSNLLTSAGSAMGLSRPKHMMPSRQAA